MLILSMYLLPSLSFTKTRFLLRLEVRNFLTVLNSNVPKIVLTSRTFCKNLRKQMRCASETIGWITFETKAVNAHFYLQPCHKLFAKTVSSVCFSKKRYTYT